MNNLMTDQENLAQLKELTPRQLEVLRLTCKGKSQEEIKDLLHIEIDTVKKHMEKIYFKLELSGKKGNPREYLLRIYCPVLPLLDDPDPTSEGPIEDSNHPPQAHGEIPARSRRVFAVFIVVAILLVLFTLVIFRLFSGGGNSDSVTSIPTITPTFTPVRPVITCGQSTIVSNISPQLADQQPFFGPFENPTFMEYFTCEGVADPDATRNDPGVLQIIYESTGNRDDFGYFGINLEGNFDATQFSELCLLVYVTSPNQAFWLKIKDREQKEGQAEINVNEPNQWLPQCVLLEEYASQGVDLRQLENVTLGFDSLLGSAEPWIDDLGFKE